MDGIIHNKIIQNNVFKTIKKNKFHIINIRTFNLLTVFIYFLYFLNFLYKSSYVIIEDIQYCKKHNKINIRL